MPSTLKERTIFGIVWSGIQKTGTILLNFISSIVLARLLTPHDYGVIGMLTIFLALSNTFIDGGFGSALIQKKNPNNLDYSTIFYWNLFLSLFLYAVLWFSAPFIAFFYNLSILTDVLRVQSLVLIINALRIVQINQLRKNLKIKIIAFVELVSAGIALIITIFLAWKGFGVWALVIQQLVFSTLSTLLCWILNKWRPLITFSKTSFYELFSFGGFILLSNLLNTFCNNIQGLLIGKVYNSSTLGLFTKAKRTEELSSTFISHILDQVSYPVLSESQNDKEKMIKILKNFITTSAYITFPLMLFLIVFAKPIFIVLYSNRWLNSVPYFQVLCISGIAICLQTINYYAVAAIGKSKELFKWTIIKRLLGLVFIVLGIICFGMYGVLFGMVLSAWSIYIINAFLVSKYVGYSLKQQFSDLFPILTLAVLTAVLTYTINIIVELEIPIISVLQAIFFCLFYIFFSYIFKFDALKNTKSVFQVLLSKLKN